MLRNCWGEGEGGEEREREVTYDGLASQLARSSDLLVTLYETETVIGYGISQVFQ